jgi:hypothetical protein
MESALSIIRYWQTAAMYFLGRRVPKVSFGVLAGFLLG